jgi:hypothetical protein
MPKGEGEPREEDQEVKIWEKELKDLTIEQLAGRQMYWEQNKD